jgi:hypothetical protein
MVSEGVCEIFHGFWEVSSTAELLLDSQDVVYSIELVN